MTLFVFMKKHLKFVVTVSIVAVVLVAMCSSCSSPELRQTLLSAESVMNDSPDSALAMLRSIDTTLLHLDSDGARYALLHMMALEKTDVNTSDVSVIQPAVDYYLKHGTDDEKLKSLFYLGRAQYNGGNYQDAIISYTRAEEFAEGCEDYYFLGLLYMEMAYTFSTAYDSETSVNFMKKSAECFWLSGNEDAYVFANLAVAKFLVPCGLYEESDSLFLSIIRNGKDSSYEPIKSAIFSLARSFITRGDYDDPVRAVELYEEGISKGYELTIEQGYGYAYSLLCAGRKRDFEALFAQLPNAPDNVNVKWWKFRIYEHLHQYAESLSLFKDIVHIQDSIARVMLGQSLYKAQFYYYSTQAATSLRRERISKVVLMLVLLIMFLFIISITLLWRNHKRKVKTDFDKMYSLAESLEQLLSEAQSQNADLEKERDELMAVRSAQLCEMDTLKRRLARLRSSFVSLHRSKFQEIVSLFNDVDKGLVDSLHGYKVSIAKINEAKNILSEIRGGESGQSMFEARLDICLDGIMSRFHTDLPNLGRDDYRLFSYLILGLDTTTISSLLGITKDNVRVRKSRLKTKISELDTSIRPLYEIYF